MYFIVHQQYVKAIYSALRQVVIHMHETEQYVSNKEHEMMRMGHISKALAQWISGTEYGEILDTLQRIDEESKGTVVDLQQAQNYVERQVKKACDKQHQIQKEILNQESLLKGLKNLLKSQAPKEEEK